MGRPLLFKTVKALQERIDNYFKECDSTVIRRMAKGDLVVEITKPYSVTGLAVYLETSRETLINYEAREPYFDAIKKAKAKIEASYEERALIGDSNPTMSIFTLKNNYGWKDQRQTDLTSGNKPIPILGTLNVSSNHGNPQAPETKKEN